MLVWNALAYQVGWIVVVMGAGMGRNLPVTLIPVALVGLHLLLTPRPALELRLALWFAATGLLVDSALGLAGVLDFSGTTPYPPGAAWLTPPWLLGLWMLFSTTLHHALRYLKQNLLAAALLGAVAGPLAYVGGYRLDAVMLPQSLPLTVAVLALTWGAVTPLLCLMSRRQDTLSVA